MKRTLATAAAALLAASAAHASSPTMTPVDGYPAFALGADVSWTPYIEANNLHTYYKSTVITPAEVTDVPAMVYDNGIDAVRLRVWVDPNTEAALKGFGYKAYGSTHKMMPTYGTCAPADMEALALRFARQGQRVMVVFQMSDMWADPGAQFVPAAWAGCTSQDQLIQCVTDHVSQTLLALKDLNVNVAWVQIGNETNSGMLKWTVPASLTGNPEVSDFAYGCGIEQGAASTGRFVKVFGAAAEAARQVYPGVKTVLHLANADDWSGIDWTLSTLASAGFGKDVCDYVGLSLYPGNSDGQEDYTAKWKTYADRAIAAMGKVADNYGFRTLLCEMGMNNEYSLSANVQGVPAADLQAAYIDQCDTDVRDFTEYLIANLAPKGCDGLFYWEPETDYMHNYKKGACVSANPGASWPRHDVRPNAWWQVIAQHSTFPAGGLKEYTITGALPGIAADADAPAQYYNLQGMRLATPHGPCIVRQGSKSQVVIFPGR